MMHRNKLWVGVIACLSAVIASATVGRANDTPLKAAIAKLTPQQQATLKAYQAARIGHDRRVDQYWREAEGKRKKRRAKLTKGKPVTAADYVKTHPPAYKGPPRPDAIYALLPKPPKPTVEPKPTIPVVKDFLREAEAQYGFKPDRVNEDDFMISYAVEALKRGLTKEQVVRVFALETGGMGTHDLQSGYNPKTGRAASTALGYAQLLAANSIEQVRKEGETYIERLERLAAERNSDDKARALRAKAAAVRRMLADARKVADGWGSHVAYAKTPKGLAMHALNLDSDIGPLMQVTKLQSVRDYAARKGMATVTGGELEMMNLAGPGSGFEMMTPIGRTMPTANFFERGGYERNPVVHDKNGAELLARLNEIMDRNMQKPGSVKFAQIFDVAKRLATGSPRPRVGASADSFQPFEPR